MLTAGNTIEILLTIASEKIKSKLEDRNPVIDSQLVTITGNLSSSTSCAIVTKLIHYGAIPFLGYFAKESCASEIQVRALWGLSNLACHDAQSVEQIVRGNPDVTRTIVLTMNSPSINVAKEAYISVGNLLTTATSADFNALLENFPELLQ